MSIIVFVCIGLYLFLVRVVHVSRFHWQLCGARVLRVFSVIIIVFSP